MTWIRDLESLELIQEPTLASFILKWLYPPRSSLKLKFLRLAILWGLTRPLASKIIGIWQKSSYSSRFIKPFISKYSIDIDDIKEPLSSFKSFNDFFIRELKPSARPIDIDHIATNALRLVAPCDGRYLFFDSIDCKGQWEFKGKDYDLKMLLGVSSSNETIPFHGGSLISIRLCPFDYHRFHAPLDLKVVSSTWHKGPLFSVNPIATHSHPKRLLENQRVCIECFHKKIGTFYLVAIGATGVGSIILNKKTQLNCFLKKGDEMGYFEFGGSSLLMVFGSSMKNDPNLLKARSYDPQTEILIKMGRYLGQINPTINRTHAPNNPSLIS